MFLHGRVQTFLPASNLGKFNPDIESHGSRTINPVKFVQLLDGCLLVKFVGSGEPDSLLKGLPEMIRDWCLVWGHYVLL